MSPGWDVLVFAGALSVAALTPGPGLAAIVANALTRGALWTVWFCIGVVIGDLVWLTLSLCGLALIAKQIPIIFILLKWAGVAYLAHLAWKSWHSDVELGEAGLKLREKSRAARALAGFAVTMGNPKMMLFYIALLPNLVSSEHLAFEAVVPFYLVLVLSAVFACYLYAAEAARRAMSSRRMVRIFNRAAATALGGAAAWIASR